MNKRIPFATISILLIGSLLPSGAVNAQDDCDGALEQAEEAYRSGAFGSAITLLAPCVDEFPPETAPDRRAHRLLALAYLRSDEIEEARLVIVELFARNPDYEADPVSDPPAFVSLVNLVREEVGVPTRAAGGAGSGGADRPAWYRAPRTWLYAVSGVVVGTAALLMIGGGGGGGGGGTGSDALPPPPAFP